MNAQLFSVFLCLVAMTSAAPVPNTQQPTTSPTRQTTSLTSTCGTSLDHRAGTCYPEDAAENSDCADPYWLKPCAGCRPASGVVIGPGHALYETPAATPTVDHQCLLDRLRVMEKDLKFITNQSDFMLNRVEEKSDSDWVDLAHKYNVPTTFKCRKGENVTTWIQAGLVTFAAHMEEVWKGENLHMKIFKDQDDCRVSRATNYTRKNIHEMLCQISVELNQDPIDTCAENYTGSGECHAPSAISVSMSSEDADMLERWSRDRVVNLYFQKFIRKAKRLIRKRIL